MVKLIMISSIEELTVCYKQILPYLEKVLIKAPEYNIEDILNNVVTNTNQLWIAVVDKKIKGIVTTEVWNFPQTSKLGIHLCGGEDIHEWVDIGISQLEDYARELKLNEVEIHGRRGWSKLLPDYRTDRVIFNKRITL